MFFPEVSHEVSFETYVLPIKLWESGGAPGVLPVCQLSLVLLLYSPYQISVFAVWRGFDGGCGVDKNRRNSECGRTKSVQNGLIFFLFAS